MNFISNIWDHPKTSTAGLLIAIVTVAGVLTQQGITLGTAGKGTVVSLIGALASALLGLLAKDPSDTSQQSNGTGQQAKLGAWALIALLLPLPFIGGCSKTSVAQDIVNWTPALQSTIAAVDSTAAMLAPADAAAFTQATAGFDAAVTLLVAQAKAYLANPSASTLAQMQNQIVVLQQQVNTALLQTARIVNSTSQQHALAAIQAVAAVVMAILGLIQSVSSKDAVKQMSAESTIKVATIDPYINRDKTAGMVAEHYGETITMARLQMMQLEKAEIEAGL